MTEEKHLTNMIQEIVKPKDTIFYVIKRISNSGQYKHIAFYYLQINDDNFSEGENRITPINISGQVAIATGFKYERKTECVGVTMNLDDPAPNLISQLSYLMFEDYNLINSCQL
jgi:hypothetical protein